MNVFDKYRDGWKKLPKIVKDVADLDGVVGQIQEHAGIQGTATDGIAKGKNRKQVAMINLVLPIANDLHALAVEREDDVLAVKTDVTFGDLANLADTEVSKRCQEIMDLAKADAAELKDGGTDAADLAEAQAAVDAYKPKATATRDAIVERKGKTGAIEEGVKRMGALFRSRIDKRMAKFKAKNPAFFTDYTNARIIVELGQRHEPPKPAPGGARGAAPAAGS